MKIFITAMIVLFSFTLSSPDSEMQVKGNCTCNGKKLYGRVKFVESFADLRVKIVNEFPDLEVRFIRESATRCGEWQLVNEFPDFTVKAVNEFPDLKIRINR